MSKPIWIFLCGLLILFSYTVMGQVRYDKNDRLLEENPQGKVKYISRDVYTVEGNKERVNKIAHITKQELAFDSAGNIILDTYGTLEDSNLSKFTFSYDKWGHEIEVNEYLFPETYMNEKFVTKYDNIGREITETKYRSDASKVYTDTFIYDTRGFLIEDYVINSYETYDEKRVYTNDDKGKIVELKVYRYNETNKKYEFLWKINKLYSPTGKVTEEKMKMNDGRIYQISQCKYDIKDSLIEKVEFGLDSILSKREYISYDKKGRTKNITTITYKDEKISTEYSHNEYDRQGRLLRSIDSSSFHSYSIFSSDKHGNVKEIITNMPMGTKDKYTYEYTYDKKGNWLTQTTFVNDEATKFIERTITYYE